MAQLVEKGVTPGLSVILVGEDPASKTYVANKEKGCNRVGIRSKTIRLAADTTQEELEKVIRSENDDPAVHGVLVQLPLPKHLDERRALACISTEKDVDGFHDVNVGRLVKGMESFVPCTPKGVIYMLKYAGIEIAGKNAVVIGRSNIVGKPAAMLLLQENATVTICHSKTANLADVCAKADILVTAIGSPKFVGENMVKEGAVVIDVGINRVDGKLCGDVDFDNVAPKCSWITPVPGGVGKMTIAMLMENTVEAAERVLVK